MYGDDISNIHSRQYTIILVCTPTTLVCAAQLATAWSNPEEKSPWMTASHWRQSSPLRAAIHGWHVYSYSSVYNNNVSVYYNSGSSSAGLHSDLYKFCYSTLGIPISNTIPRYCLLGVSQEWVGDSMDLTYNTHKLFPRSYAYSYESKCFVWGQSQDKPL